MANRITGWSHILVVFGLQGLKNANVDKSDDDGSDFEKESKQNGAVVLRTMEVGPRLMRPVRRRRAFSIAQNYHDCTMH